LNTPNAEKESSEVVRLRNFADLYVGIGSETSKLTFIKIYVGMIQGVNGGQGDQTI
jgi:hypothetical protein